MSGFGSSRLLDAILVGIVLTQASLFGSVVVSEYRQFQDEQAVRLQRAAEEASRASEEFFDRHGAVLDALSEVRPISRSEPEAATELLRALNSRFPEAVNFAATDAAGRFFASGKSGFSEASPIEALPFFRCLAAGTSRVVMEPHQGPISGRLVTGLAVALRGGEGAFEGVLGVSLDFSPLETRWRELVEGTDLSLAVHDAAGVVYHASPSFPRWQGAAVPGLAIDQDPLALDGGTHRRATVRDGASGWDFTVLAPPRPTLASFLRQRAELLLFGSPILVLLVALSWWYRKERGWLRDRAARERRYRSLLEMVPLGVEELDPEGSIRYANPALHALTGAPAGALVGRSVWEFPSVEEERERLRAFFARAAQERPEPVPYLGRITALDGREVTVEVHWDYLRDETGRPAGFIAVLKDVTARHEADEALRESERRFRTAFHTSPDSMTLTRLDDGMCVDVNSGFTAITGYDRAEAIGRTTQELGIWADPSERAELTARLRVEGAVRDFEVRFRHRDGHVVEGVLSAAVMPIAGKLHILSTNRDVTEQKAAAADLHRLNQLREGIIENANVWITVLDESLRVVLWNRAAEQISGYRREEILGVTAAWERLFPGPQHGAALQAKARAVLDGEALEGFEAVVRGKDGRDRVVSWSARRLIGTGGAPSGAIAVGRDVTEEHRLRDQLLHSQKMEAVGTLASGIAHDFNNIVHAISGYADFLLSREGHPRETREGLGEIARAADRASELVRGLLAFARRDNPVFRAVDANREIRDVLRLLEHAMPRMTRIEARLADGAWPVHADANQLAQVLLNLAANARDAMTCGGTMTLETENVVLDGAFCAGYPGLAPGRYVRITVADTGAGMDAETARRAFEPFFTTKKVGEGTGLGLSTVYGIVAAHRGLVTLESELGRGTRFEIYLPVSAGLAPAAEPVDAPASACPSSPPKVLVVDDEPAVLALARTALHRQGYGVLTAPTGEAALDLIREHREAVDLVLLDLGMPGMGGQACLEELLRIQPELRVLVASGYGADAAERALGAGAFGFIPKPYRFSELVSRVRSAPGRHPSPGLGKSGHGAPERQGAGSAARP
ncbi:MAG: PAS domain S-box protein [Deferrisomatales bacterium]|nr:PAS domain S-box protein [Deferrisomatales bacterium]